MILTREEILKHPKIVIEPRNEELISINSVDVRLGYDLWTIRKNFNEDIFPIRDLYNPDDNVWEKISPVSATIIKRNYPNWAKGVVPDDASCFVLESGRFYLATTLEKIGALPPDKNQQALVPEMKAKSTVGRQGLTVALCAGLGDVGYVSRWALEVRVTNDGDVPIAVGTPIAQVVFHLASPTEVCYDGESRYQNQGQVRFLPKPLKYIGVQ